jgi:hypothetical protein
MLVTQQRLLTIHDRYHLGAHPLHPEYVRPLAPDIDGAHIDLAVKSESRRHGSRGIAMLPGPGLRDDTFLAHARDEQALAHDVIDLVGAGMIEVFTLDVYSCTTKPVRQEFPAKMHRHNRRNSLPDPHQSQTNPSREPPVAKGGYPTTRTQLVTGSLLS